MAAKHRLAGEHQSLFRRVFPNRWAAVWLLAGVLGVLLTYFRTTLEKLPLGWAVAPLAAGFFALAWFAQRLDKIRSEEEKTADFRETTNQAMRMFVGVSDVLRPLGLLLLDVTDMSCVPADRKSAMSILRQSCVASVATTSGAARARSCLFEFDDDQETLIWKAYYGRSDEPASRFYLGVGTPYTDILEMLNGTRAVLNEDVDLQLPQAWDATRARDYRTFIRAPIRSKRHVYGMLTVDAPEAGTLGETDAELLSTVATILAAGFAAQKATSMSQVLHNVGAG